LKLKESNIISKEEINNCIEQSLDVVLKSKTEKEAKKYMRNMNAFVEKARIIYKSVSENCLPKTN
jgi:archaellum biogenesis ATPase FlaH